MTDYFALLREPRRPWLDADFLKSKFHTLSAEVHPDRVHQSSEGDRRAAHQCFTELSAAYDCLCDPRRRIRHLLELELGIKPSDLTQVPDYLMDLFFTIGKMFREVEGLYAEKAKTTSPLLQVQLFARGQEWVEQLGGVRDKICARREALLEELKVVDVAWALANPKPTSRLLEIWRLLGFYDRWLAQIQEHVGQLSF